MARLLGIDLGSDALRGVVVRTALRKLEVERYIEIPITAPEGSPSRLPELAEAGRNLLAAAGPAPDGVIAAIAGDESSLRAVQLPAAAKKRIAEILPFELEALLPFEPRDAVIDFQPAAPDTEGVQLMVAAVLRPRIEATIVQLKQGGLDPQELAAGAPALDGLCVLLPQLRSARSALIVDLGDSRTDLCMLANGYCIQGRTIGTGLNDMPGAADDARSELQRSLAAFRGAGAEAPDTIYLCGSGAGSRGAEWLSDVFGMPVQLLPLPQATQSATPAAAKFGKAAALAARSALGRRRINLRTGDFAPTHVRGQLTGQLNLIVSCIVLIVVCAMFSLKAEQSQLVTEEEALSTELATVTKEVLGETITDPSVIEDKIKNPTSTDPLPRFDAFDAVATLSASVPIDIAHEVKRLHVDVADDKAEGRFELQGSIDSLEQRDTIVTALQKSPCFQQIELGRTNSAPGQTRITYQLEATLECPGDVTSAKKSTKKKSGSSE